MPRMLDLECAECGAVVKDKFFRTVPKFISHRSVADAECDGRMEQVFLPRSRSAQWSDRDAVVVFKKPDGSFSYPGRNDAATPPGCERVVMRSLREVERFEKQNNVLCEAMHYNSGNGPEPQDFRDPRPPERERFAAFMRGWNGG